MKDIWLWIVVKENGKRERKNVMPISIISCDLEIPIYLFFKFHWFNQCFPFISCILFLSKKFYYDKLSLIHEHAPYIVRFLSKLPLVQLSSFLQDSIFLSILAEVIFFTHENACLFSLYVRFSGAIRGARIRKGESPISVIWMDNGLTLEVGPPVNDGPERDPADEMLRAISLSLLPSPIPAFSLRPDRD